MPLLIGFFLIALLVVAGSVAAADAAAGQQELQSSCDSAAIAVAATALESGRDETTSAQQGVPVRFQSAVAQSSVTTYLARDTARANLRIDLSLSSDARSVTLHCQQEMSVTMGALFGRSTVVHNAESTAQAPAH